MEILKNEDLIGAADGNRHPFPGTDGPESTLHKDWDGLAGAVESVDLESRLACIKAARNPLLEASAPLLRALAEMPAALPEGQSVLETLREMLAREVNTFQNLCDKANLRREHVLTARYSLCTALDEAAAGMPWGKGGVWAHHSLAQRFHGDVHGGQKFFLLIGRLLDSPQEHLDLLEVMYRILGMGFQGMYINTPESRRELESIRHTLLTKLNGAREPVPPALSPHWRGEASGAPSLLRSVPVWVSASVLGLILFAFFAWNKYGLLNESMVVAGEIEALARLPVPPRAPLRLAELLKDEIAAGRVAVQDEAQQSSVVFRGDDMFLPARAAVSPKIEPTLDRLAAEVAKVPGKVIVTGHSDGQPIQTRDFPNNQVLSEKRAAAVADYLADKGVDRSRLEAVGKGADDPLADNATPAGRARNRRVEILVWQSNAQPRME
ncbi:type VI secretion system protein TssL, long form [Azonexus sp.]|jgi:type VI secretion system protein ImpK|uniref:type VI secretion system protein TssL, long form n=1 Tax=Azonexus sp. TaxID=1872668 RepID=UPI002823D3B0|nr:type VI secretion system protein TssL, long form [Azonexus sp.]MDR1995537.1 type VI secretion system protein TssL, long form [Azonexus sp.]